MPDIAQWKKAKVAELKAELKRRNLNTDGRKDELLNRLITAISSEQASLPTSSYASKQTIVNTQSKPTQPPSVTTTITMASNVNSPIAPAASKPSTQTPSTTAAAAASAKSNSTSNPIVASDATPPPPISPSHDHKVVTLAPVVETEEERQRKRAARFAMHLASSTVASGNVEAVGALTEAERMELRKKRFASTAGGDSNNSNSSINDNKKTVLVKTGKNGPQVALDVDTLRKRAEKFGSASLSAEAQQLLTALEEEEKKRKRAERFAVSSSAYSPPLQQQQAEKVIKKMKA
ncbi:hypothetical protein SeMB42_g05276 [Synchytrium endobioticum]|uniref:SAP domain-containing protein n=1 Tax=Synchytrium endobioticum TaxID=286115 RepID=A0A507CRL2_9FUNG|nr:hypothetical protein SeLEV6574_g05912 [Synchytrium endobioticum]TPX42128.1 hypothetical protein SeMB42_g05276 [Synchytrium endobioticum]